MSFSRPIWTGPISPAHMDGAHITGGLAGRPRRRRPLRRTVQRRAAPGRIRGCTCARGGDGSPLGEEAAIRAAPWRISRCLSGCPSLRCLPKCVGLLGSCFKKNLDIYPL
jgi:hypothetical protein